MARTPDHQSTTTAAESLPSVDRIQQELATAESIDDFFGTRLYPFARQ
jgi:hypothetical protein